MRLTKINLAGFKSFVDPTHIPVPGQLVGIVGPNGCGKSNVIDAVRWVLGETSAKHLRGETMQDVLFNGSGERRPVNRASVELMFDNSLGKAAGQWSNYAEVSIKRVLERDGASSYYINNIHVRRRDVADIFLGTGLGSRAYAIIEQGMISRVIEAKPEELRIFLEEAAGVSKYRERRRETELRLRDTRENLTRVEDIRQELDKQLEHLRDQAEVAKRYHELQSELTTAQHLLWFTRKQEAGATRARHGREIERIGIELEAETAKLRESEKRLEELRDQHYRAGDEMHAAQGALYEINSEAARFEQQIAHLRENRRRVEHQLATLGSQNEHSRADLAAAEENLKQWREERERMNERAAGCERLVAEESGKLPVTEEAFRATLTRREESQRGLAQAEQALQVEQTKIEHAKRVLEQLAMRRERLLEEQQGLPAGDAAALGQLQQSMQTLEGELRGQRGMLAEKEHRVPQLEQALRERADSLDAAVQSFTALEARLQALTQLQDRLARGAGMEGWLAERELDRAPRLWQGIEIEAGWEDALEAVLRERLNSIALPRLDQSAVWLRDPPPGKMTVFGVEDGGAAATTSLAGAEPLRRYVTCRNPRMEAVLEDWLYDVFVVPDAGAGLALRQALPAGGLLVSREGHVFTRRSVSFHAPDSDLHGVLSRQREIGELGERIGTERAQCESLRHAVSAAEREIEQHKTALAELRRTVSDTQQQHHQVQIEALKLFEQAQRLTQRSEQIAAELREVEGQNAAEAEHQASAEASLARLQQEVGAEREQRELAADLYRRAESVLSLQREAVQKVQREHQEAVF
ncbi:MAG: chromosome segregation protein SMC, partial [Betaproteobacteria bacterium]|nr:chromosome segregation protein SMC [Betaproteobacteria bacterium]